jgi:hypothetical protein
VVHLIPHLRRGMRAFLITRPLSACAGRLPLDPGLLAADPKLHPCGWGRAGICCATGGLFGGSQWKIGRVAGFFKRHSWVES